MPPALVWLAGVVGAVYVAHLIAKEWRRVNEELDRRRAPAPAENDRRPDLRRDPDTGVYRP